MPASGDPILSPHPMMPHLYGNAAQKREWLGRIFDQTAADYDRVESWMSLGSGERYRRQALRRAGLAAGMSVADVACGTGLTARQAKALVGPTGRVVGVDPSRGMLERMRCSLDISALVGIAECLPLESGRFDFLSMGYALRHVEDLQAAFGEFFRVLKPGGRLCVLEVTRPGSAVGRAMLRLYMGAMSMALGRIGGLQRRTAELWDYYWRTIDLCVRPDQVILAMRRAGFDQVEHRMELGVFSEYTALRPSTSIRQAST